MFYDHIDHHGLRRLLRTIGHGRDSGHRGFGRGGRGFGHGFRGDDDFPRGRRLGAEDLQVVLLALLAEQPAHGYELIRLLEERSGGFYVPSPGVIYPALTYLEEVGYAAVTQTGNRKLYALTEEGRAYLEQNREQATAILDELRRIGARMGEVREAFAGMREGDPRASDVMHAAWHGLKHALMRKRGCSPEEAQRIARIIERATAEILAQG